MREGFPCQGHTAGYWWCFQHKIETSGFGQGGFEGHSTVPGVEGRFFDHLPSAASRGPCLMNIIWSD